VDYESRSFLLDVLKEIDRTEGKEMNRDSGGTKAVSQFLVELAERIPDKLQPCLCILVNYLDGESFMLRLAFPLDIFAINIMRISNAKMM